MIRKLHSTCTDWASCGGILIPSASHHVTVETDAKVKLISRDVDEKEYRPTKGKFKKGISGSFLVMAKSAEPEPIVFKFAPQKK